MLKKNTDFEVQLAANLTIVKCSNRIDVYNAQEFEKFLMKSIEDHSGDFGIDLSGVTFISSVGLRAMIYALNTLTKRGNSMFLVAPNANILELIRICGFEGLFRIIEKPTDIK